MTNLILTPAVPTTLTLTPANAGTGGTGGSDFPFGDVKRLFTDFAALKAAYATFGDLKASI